jgi:hypothetical protein
VLLLAAAAWTGFVWITRLVNLAGDDRSASFIAVHVVIAAISLVLAVPVAIIGWRLLRGESPLPGRAG